jgi:hypothetical protein
MKIVHFYGSLGLQLERTELERGYEPKLTADFVKVAADGIRILHQGDRGNAFLEAASVLELAQEIIFLGFGFHDENMVRLALKETKAFHVQQQRPALWWACRTGMGDGEIERVKSANPTLEIQFAMYSQWDIETFLNETPCLKP